MPRSGRDSYANLRPAKKVVKRRATRVSHSATAALTQHNDNHAYQASEVYVEQTNMRVTQLEGDDDQAVSLVTYHFQ